MNLSSTPPLHPGDRVRITHLFGDNSTTNLRVGDVWVCEHYADGIVDLVASPWALSADHGDRWEIIEEAA